MKQVNYILKVKNVDTNDSMAWEENISEIIEDNISIEQHAIDLVVNFNKYLRAYEKQRLFISATNV